MQPYSSTGVGMSLMGLADIKARPPDVRFTPESDIRRHEFDVRFVPKADIERRSKSWPYSINSSARASSAGGTARSSAFAVLRLMASSYLVGVCTGRSAGFSPLRMRST
jgi:hypothetical protein